jgi:hypothetical protein
MDINIVVMEIQMDKRITFLVDEEIHREFKIKAATDGKKMTEIIMAWVHGYLYDQSSRTKSKQNDSKVKK